jgi:serine/threonine protein kinase
VNKPTLGDLLLRWEQAHAMGQDLSPAQLCPDHPDLIPELAVYIDAVRQRHGLTVPPTEASPAVAAEDLPTVGPLTPADPSSAVPATVPPTLAGPAEPGPDCGGLPGYEILEELGRGGMGVVHKARQTRLNRIVALKMILAGQHAGEEARARFLVEAEAIAAVRHPGIVQIHDYGTYGELAFFVLEFCAGGSLAGRLAGRPLPAREAADLVEQVARGIQAAHDKGIIHRDLKPGNVLLDENGRPKVTDFGLARRVEGSSGLTQTGAVMGTPSYMAPEQATDSKTVGPGADVYALGAILYECLTGKPPFLAASTHETLQQVIHEEPIGVRQLNRAVPRALETICHKCLEKKPARRNASAAELGDDLNRFLQGRPILARPPGFLERLSRWTYRDPLVALGLLATAVLTVLGLGLASYWGHSTAIDGYREGLTHQQLESNRHSARLVANAVQQNLRRRTRRLEQWATNQLDAAIRKQSRAELNGLLGQLLKGGGRSSDLFSEATVTSATGQVLAQVRVVPNARGVSVPRPVKPNAFARHEHSPNDRTPPGQTHISAPYVSSAPNHPMFISISVPIREQPAGAVVGVLEGAVLLKEMNAWLNSSNIDADGFAVLFDSRGHCVLHRDPSFAPTPDRGARRFLTADQQQDLFPDAEGVLDSYTDPVDGKVYLAGYARMDRRIGWVAVVQHNREKVVTPLERLRGRLRRVNFIAFGVGACLVSGLFFSLFWLLSRRK